MAATQIVDVAGENNNRPIGEREFGEADVATVRIAVIQENEAPRRHLVLAHDHEELERTPTRTHRRNQGQRRPLARANRAERNQDGSLLGRRVCYCCLVVPFFLAFVMSAISTVTLAVKNEEVKRKCPGVECVLTCNNDNPKVYLADCWIVQGGGGLVCLMLLLFIVSQVVRMWFATKR